MRSPRWWIKPLSIGALIALSCCKSSDLKESSMGFEDIPGETLLVSQGDSSQASYSDDGQRIIFVSKNRKGHNYSQVYEKNLATGIERRVTFQNGNTAFPRYQPKANDWILYSSSTDELKEAPPKLKDSATILESNLPYNEPLELYLHSLNSLEIKRLTHQIGFDGEGSFSPDGKFIYWTRNKGKNLEILGLNSKTMAASLTKGPTKNASNFVVSSNGQWRAWLEWDQELKTNQVVLMPTKKAAVKLKLEVSGTRADLNFSADSKYLLWSERSSVSDPFEIWGMALDTQCIKKIYSSLEDRRHPVISPDGRWLTFTSWRKGRSRIAQVPFNAESSSCVSGP